jgi:hypothetical protein
MFERSSGGSAGVLETEQADCPGTTRGKADINQPNFPLILSKLTRRRIRCALRYSE